MAEEDSREIGSISFGIYSPEEILAMSVCKVHIAKKSGYGTVYDERMGTTDSTKLCETCNQTAEFCPGHFGHIELNEPVVHPLFYKRVLTFLNCYCSECNRLLLTRDQIYLDGLNRYKGERRFDKIQEKIKKVDMCCHVDCGSEHPKYKFSTADSSYCKVYEGKDKVKTSITINTDEIKKIFDNISNEQVELLGINAGLAHPRNYILTVIPVLPTCARPFVKADNNLCDDDLTNQYTEIIKVNNHLDLSGTDSVKDMSETKRQKALASLRFRILTTFNNGQGKAKHSTNGRAIKGIKERLAGKDGQIRNNMMGKRSCKFDTMIWEWNGDMKRAEDIKIGDVVIGDDGLPRNVIDLVECVSPSYKIKQAQGEDYWVSNEHILTVKYNRNGQIVWRDNQGKYGGWIMFWYDPDKKRVTTHKISVQPSFTKDEAKTHIDQFIKETNIKSEPRFRQTKPKPAGFWIVNWTDEDGKKKSKEIGVVIGKTKEQAYEELENLQQTLNVDPMIDIHVKDYIALSNLDKSSLLGVKLSVPIQWPKKDVILDSRILGMWLGDGSASKSGFTNPDKELIEYFREWTEKQGGKFHTYPDNLHHGISNCGFLDFLRHYDLDDNKHIPEDYIVNDAQTRLELLAGLIDTDGSVEQGGVTVRISQCFEHKAIIDGAERIANSLGFRTSVNTKKTTWTVRGEKKKGEALILSISGNISVIPTLLERKKCVDSAKDMSVTKIEVVEDGVDRFCGFEVDGNNRFILGSDATITHNCNQTGRTVIGPDPTLKFGELGVPDKIADILSVPVRVNNFNLEWIQKVVNDGKADFVVKPDGKTRINLKRYRKGTRLISGDVIIRGDSEIVVKTGREMLIEGDRVRRNGSFLDKLLYSERNYKIDVGWIVHRKLQDGDYVLLNRQPTLHKASMMAMQIKRKKHKTFTMNLAITKPFNADFNIGVKQED